MDKLQNTIDITETLQTQNKLQQSNYEQLKLAFEKLQGQFEELTIENQQNIKEQESLNNHIQEQSQKWTRTLDSKQQEIETLKTEYPYSKKQVELLRIQIFEEYTLANASKWKLYDQDLEKYQLKCLEVTKIYNQLQQDFKRNETIYKQDILELKSQHQDELGLLESRLVALQSQLDSSSDGEKLRQLQRDKSDLEIIKMGLLSENQELRAQLEELKVAIEQQSRLSKKQILEYSSTTKAIQSENDAYKMKIKTLNDELYDLKRINDVYMEKQSNLQKEVDTLKSRNEVRCHEFNLEVNQFKVDALKAQNKYEHELEILQEKLKESEICLQLSNEAQNKSHAALLEQEKEFLCKIQWTKEQEWAKIAQLESEKSDMENKSSHYKKEYEHVSSLMESLEKELSLEITRLKDQVKTLTSERESLLSSNQKLNAERERHFNKATEFSCRLEEIKVRLDKANQEVERLGSETLHLQQENSKLSTVNTNLSRETKELNVQLEKEVLAHQHNLERIQSQFINEKSLFHQELQSIKKENLELQETCKSWESATKKQQKLYLNKVNQLKIQLKEFNTLLQSKEVDHSKTRDQLEELRMKQSNFLQFLQSEVAL